MIFFNDCYFQFKMGLDYSIEIFVKEAKLIDALHWLSEKLYDYEEPKFLQWKGKDVKIGGRCFKNDRNVFNGSPLQLQDKLSFTTSLIFDIDPVIINSLATHYPYCFNIKDFENEFENYYLGNGKIRIGGFDSEIRKSGIDGIYHLMFTAVTTPMSSILVESLSVKKWIEELSEVSEAIVSYIDMESAGHKLLFYKGKKIDITFSEPYDIPQDETAVFFDEYFKLIKNDYENSFSD